MISNDGHIYTCGGNNYGQLGLGMVHKDVTAHNSPIQVENLKSVKCSHIACGWNSTLAVTEKGEAFSWGRGDHGSLGLGSQDNEYSPQKIHLKDDIYAQVLKVSSGSRHSALVTTSGKIYSFGANEVGQLGHGYKSKMELSPKEIEYPQNYKFIDVSCGTAHTLFLTQNGQVFASGNNKFGQLGNGTKKNSTQPVLVQGLERAFIQNISCGHHSGALTTKGQLYLWGTGSFGEYLYPTNVFSSSQYIQNFQIGGLYGVASDSQGNVYSWGSNSNGELGIGTQESKTKPTLLPDLQNVDVKQISCGTSHVFILGKDIVNNLLSQQQQQFQQDSNMIQVQDQNYFSQFQHQNQKSLKNSQINNNTHADILGYSTSRPNKKRGASVQLQPNNIFNQSIISPSNQGLMESFSKSSFLPHQSSNQQYNTMSQNQQMYREQNSKLFDYVSQDPTIDIVISENKYIETNLKLEKEERRRLEKMNLELRLKIKELQDGKGGVKELDENLDQCIQEINNLKERFEQSQVQNESLQLEAQKYQNENLVFKELVKKQEQEIISLKQEKLNLEDRLAVKLSDFDIVERENSKNIELIKQRKQSYENEIQHLKQTIYELQQDISREQENKKRTEHIKNNERRELVQLEQEKQNLLEEQEELRRKQKAQLFALESEIQLKQKTEDGLLLAQERIKNLELENQSLLHEVSELRKVIYEDLEVSKGSNSIQVESLLKINQQIKQENQQLKLRSEKHQQDFIDMKAKFNLLLSQLQQSEHKNLQLTSVIDQQQQSLSQSQSQNEILNNGQKPFVQEQKDRQLTDLLESASKHAKNMTRIIKNSNLASPINVSNPKYAMENSPEFRNPTVTDLRQTASPLQSENFQRIQTESDKKYRKNFETSPMKENYLSPHQKLNNMNNLNDIQRKLQRLQKDKQKIEVKLQKFDNKNSISTRFNTRQLSSSSNNNIFF